MRDALEMYPLKIVLIILYIVTASHDVGWDKWNCTAVSQCFQDLKAQAVKLLRHMSLH